MLPVDAVVGQTNQERRQFEYRGMDHPDAASFGDVNDIKFDGASADVCRGRSIHTNCITTGRIIAFLAQELCFSRRVRVYSPDLPAQRVYVATDFNQPVGQRIFLPGEQPFSPVCVAFDSRNQMVVGNDGYYGGDFTKRNVNQLLLYGDPIKQPDA